MQMEKTTLISSLDKNKRNGSFCKHSRKNLMNLVSQLPPIQIHEAKTVKCINKKDVNIPALKLADLKPTQRPKILSLNHKNYQKMATERKSTTTSTEDVSFFLQECDLLITRKNPSHFFEIEKQNLRKSNILPPITTHGNTTPMNFAKLSQNLELIPEIKKKPRAKIQCKVLLAKYNDFPFYGSHIHDLKKSQRINTKQSVNPQHIDLFDLDISRISEVDEMPNINFVSQESLKEIPLF